MVMIIWRDFSRRQRAGIARWSVIRTYSLSMTVLTWLISEMELGEKGSAWHFWNEDREASQARQDFRSPRSPLCERLPRVRPIASDLAAQGRNPNLLLDSYGRSRWQQVSQPRRICRF